MKFYEVDILCLKQTISDCANYESRPYVKLYPIKLPSEKTYNISTWRTSPWFKISTLWWNWCSSCNSSTGTRTSAKMYETISSHLIWMLKFLLRPSKEAIIHSLMLCLCELLVSIDTAISAGNRFLNLANVQCNQLSFSWKWFSYSSCEALGPKLNKRTKMSAV